MKLTISGKEILFKDIKKKQFLFVVHKMEAHQKLQTKIF
jgi:hypothetical protein